MAIQLSANSTFLFIGDSITDVGRRTCPEQIGNGYVRMVRDYLSAKDPKAAPKVVNRGISGNKVPDLEKRWQRDVLDERPDVLSVYIGINDVWHGFAPRNEGTELARYGEGYRGLLKQTLRAFPKLTLVLVEPSVLWLGTPADANEQLIPYVKAVRELATEFGAVVTVPLHETFNAARAARPDIAWTTDGCHPTSTGHMLIARTWLASTGLL
ncbi:MAG: SGNH/GDSL hydrolase family protein [Tepidisphaeraceae bacterium]